MKTVLVFSLSALCCIAEAQVTNSWIKPSSGNWEDPTGWSLGILPGAGQSVMITNQGYKAVAINSSTPVNFPASMTVSNLNVSAPTNALSTLLLNYAGTAVPLKVLNGCTIGTNGTLDNLESGFEMDGNNGGQLIVDGGTYVQEGGQTILSGPVAVLNNGSINTTNANLTLGNVTIGAAPSSFGAFIQDGGSIAAQQIIVSSFALTAPLQPWPEPSGYRLVSGVLYAIDGTQCSAAGPGFRQFGGTNYGDISVTQGYYELRSGLAKGNVLTAAGSDGNSGLFDQEGGLLDMQYINVSGGSNWPPDIGPTFSGGAVHCGTLNIGGNGKVDLRGADVFVTNNFDLHGMEFNVGDQGPLIEHATCGLWGGHLYLPSMTMGQYADFDQQGGSNEISGGLSIVGGQYNLFGGTLETASTSVGAAVTFPHWEGQHLVHGVLSISGTYTLNNVINQTGCQVLSAGLYLRGALMMTINFNGLYNDPPANFTNTGVLNFGGTISTGLPDVTLGQVQLATNASLAFLNGYPAVTRFSNSSAVAWTPGALLVITNWSSSDHVFVGNDASGLTASQLQQIQFANPSGFSPGSYPAKILSTGEIVPDSSGTPPPGLVNNWINPISDKWENAASWSLGIAPASNQVVNITNAGYKAVSVDSATLANFPASLTVSNLSVSAPSNALSTLLLNYAGVGTPLKVRDNCVIGTNGTIANYYSSFEVDGSAGGTLVISGGQFIQEGGLTVATNVLITEGSLNATNAAMTLGALSMGTYVGDYHVEVNQSGGSIAAASVSIYRSSYNLQSGALYAMGGTGLASSGTFNQYGGTNFGDVNNAGAYRLLDGLVRGTNVSGSYGTFYQGGGEVQASTLYITGNYPYAPNYFLTNGLLSAGTLSISSSTFQQIGGQVVLTNGLLLNGQEYVIPHTGFLDVPSFYAMQGGTLLSPSITVTQGTEPNYSPGLLASFNQTGGTNTVAGDLTLSSTAYSLDATSLLQTTNSFVNSEAVFYHQNGTHNVAGVLSISGAYHINGGNVSMGGLWMHGLLAIANSSGTPVVSCSGLMDLGSGATQPGVVQVQAGTHHLGSLRLTGDSMIQFGSGSVTINFDASSSIGWSNGVSLVISNWNNPGSAHIFFGNNGSSLTGSQLAQITFANPGGFSAGNYAAQLLSTGELVPLPQPTLQSARYGSALVLTWPAGFQLLSATNVSGPYTPMSGASSPYTNFANGPQEFFRLQGQ